MESPRNILSATCFDAWHDRLYIQHACSTPVLYTTVHHQTGPYGPGPILVNISSLAWVKKFDRRWPPII